MHETPCQSQYRLLEGVLRALERVYRVNTLDMSQGSSLIQICRYKVGNRRTVGSVLVGRVDGVCIILIFALRKKSAEPPKPFNILEPMTQVEFAWA